MPLRLPDKLPAIELLKHENIFVMDYSRAHMQDIRPLKMVILNLMPLKITTETDLIRLFPPQYAHRYYIEEIDKADYPSPVPNAANLYRDDDYSNCRDHLFGSLHY